MNLYAIQPDHSFLAPEFTLAKNDEEALEQAVYAAAHDMVDGGGSPTATVYLVAAELTQVGQARAGACSRPAKRGASLRVRARS